jgi:hypothetical protein
MPEGNNDKEIPVTEEENIRRDFKTGKLDYDSARKLCQSCIIGGEYVFRKKGVLSDGGEVQGCVALGFPEDPSKLYGDGANLETVMDYMRKRLCHNFGEMREFDKLEGGYGYGWYFTCPNPTKEAEND